MLPFASPLTSVSAASWLTLGVPGWVSRGALTAGWVLALAAAAIGSTVTPCTPLDPAICGSDQGFAWWVVISVVTPLLLVWLPLLGCTAGVAFAFADLAYDDVTSANIGFGVHGVACAVVAAWLLRSAAEQERAAADAGGGIRAAVTPTHARPGSGWSPVRTVSAATLVLLGAALIGWYAHDVRLERGHLSVAERVTGRVVAVDDANFVITLDAAGATGSRRVETGVLDAQPYPMGSTTPVLLDPGDLSWSRLVAEPQDATGWESGGLLAFLLALLLALRELQVRQAHRRLWAGEYPALRVWVMPDEDGNALLFPDDGASPERGRCEPFARMSLVTSLRAAGVDEGDQYRDQQDEDDWDDNWWKGHGEPIEPKVGHDTGGPADPWDDHEGDAGARASFGRMWRGEEESGDEWPDDEWSNDATPVEPVQAVLLGSLRDRGWALLVTEDEVLAPSAPLRAVRVAHPGPGARARLLSGLPFGSWRDQGGGKDVAGPVGRHSGQQGEPADDAFPPGVPISPTGKDLPDLSVLPLEAGTPARARALGALMLAAALAGAPGALVFLDLGWHARIAATIFGAELLRGGAGRALQHLRLTETHLEVAGSYRVHFVPWELLHGVRREDAVLAIAWEPDTIVEVGPFDADGGSTAQQARAEELGTVMVRLRDRALAIGAAGRPAFSRLGPAWTLFAVYMTLMGVALWIVVNR